MIKFPSTYNNDNTVSDNYKVILVYGYMHDGGCDFVIVTTKWPQSLVVSVGTCLS